MVAPEQIPGSFQAGGGREALLSRLVIELSRLAEGGDEKLDYLLEQLRQALRVQHNGDLKNSAEQFLKYVVSGRVDFSTTLDSSIKKSALELVIAMGDCFPNVAQINDIRQALEEASTLQETARLVESLIPVMIELQAHSGGATAGGGLFSLEDLVQLIGPALDRLLEQLQLLDLEPSRIKELRDTFRKVSNESELDQVLGQALELVVDVAKKIEQERQQTEQFLAQLRLQLKELSDGVANSVDFEGSGQNIDALRHGVRDQASSITTIVTEQSDIAQLKLLVQENVQTLLVGIDRYVQEEKDRLDVAQSRINELVDQAQTMDAEIEKLRYQVIEKQKALLIDALTGVENRGGFDKRIDKEIARARRTGDPMSLLVVDVDNFKSVNDSLGHKAGDLVLQTVARLLSQRVRDTDYIARYGGDEFVLILPDTAAGNARKLAEGLCGSIRNCAFRGRGEPIKVTLSIGIAELGDVESAEDLFERADVALYQVKEQGRDGCAVA